MSAFFIEWRLINWASRQNTSICGDLPGRWTQFIVIIVPKGAAAIVRIRERTLVRSSYPDTGFRDMDRSMMYSYSCTWSRPAASWEMRASHRPPALCRRQERTVEKRLRSMRPRHFRCLQRTCLSAVRFRGSKRTPRNNALNTHRRDNSLRTPNAMDRSVPVVRGPLDTTRVLVDLLSNVGARCRASHAALSCDTVGAPD